MLCVGVPWFFFGKPVWGFVFSPVLNKVEPWKKASSIILGFSLFTYPMNGLTDQNTHLFLRCLVSYCDIVPQKGWNHVLLPTRA